MDVNMDRICINGDFETSFLNQHGKDVKTVFIPAQVHSYNINYILLSECPNIERFINEGSEDFEFLDGILYSICRTYGTDKVTKRIEYVTKAVKNLFISNDINGISSYTNGVETVTVDKENTAFTVFNNMLLDKDMRNLYLVFSNAREVEIPEGVDKIDSNAFADCEMLKRIVFPSTYTWTEAISINENIKNPDIIIHGDWASYADDIIVSKLSGPCAYLGDRKCCKLPNYITKANRLDNAFKYVESFDISNDHPTFASIDGMIVDKTKTKLLFYPRTRHYFNIPDSITKICSHAVSNCNYIENITIPNTVKEIDKNAFANCLSLKKVDFPDSDIKCGPDSFSGCSFDPIDGIYYFGNIVYGIDFAYKGDLRIKEGAVTLMPINGPGRAGVVEFGATDVNAEILFIPASINEIGTLLAPLKEINVDEQNSYYCSVDGVLFSKDLKHLIRYPERRRADTYTVPDGVEYIDNLAFHNCKCIHNVTLPDSIRAIGEEAFSYAELHSIELPQTPIEINDLAFTPFLYYKYGGKNQEQSLVLKFRFKDTKIPVKLLGNWNQNEDEKKLALFIGTNNLVRKNSLYSDVKTSGYKQFMAFYLALTQNDEGCLKYLQRIKNKLTKGSIYSGLLKYLDLGNIKQSEVKKTEIDKKKRIKLSDWAVCDSPDGFFEIEKYKGKDVEVEIPDEYKGVPITAIGESAFSGQRAGSCLKIEKIVIPDSIKYIGDKAFSHCEKLKELKLPGALETIGKEAFSACRKIKAFDLPDSVKEIDCGAFSGCSGIKDFSFPPLIDKVSDSTLKGCVHLETVKLSINTKKIGNSAFDGCNRLKTIAIPEAVVSIDAFAFRGCKNLIGISLPQDLQSIGTLAFQRCELIKSVHLPQKAVLDNSVGSPFGGCDALTDISVDSDSEDYSCIDGVLFDKTGEQLVRYPNGKGGSYSIPDGIKTIGRFAFEGCSDLHSVDFPDSVTLIKQGAFQDCRLLGAVTLSKNLDTVENDAFRSCGLTDIELPMSLKMIGENAFSSCHLRSVVVPEGVTEIGYNAFFLNTDLEKVILPSSVTSMGDAFKYCQKIKVYAPKGSFAEECCKKQGIELVESPADYQ